MTDLAAIADEAEVIVRGYAVDRCEDGSAKFFVMGDGQSSIQKRGMLNDREIAKIQQFIAEHYREMYLTWAEYSEQGFYRG